MAIASSDEAIITQALQNAISVRSLLGRLPTAPPALATLRTDSLADLDTLIGRLNAYLDANL